MKEKKTNEREDRGRQCQLVRLRGLHASFSLLKSLWGRRDSGFLSAWAGMMGGKKIMIINREEGSLLARFARTKGKKNTTSQTNQDYITTNIKALENNNNNKAVNI